MPALKDKPKTRRLTYGMDKVIVSDDVLISVLYMSNCQKFTMDTPTIHSALYDASEMKKYEKLFENILFRKKDWFPFSEQIDSAFNNFFFNNFLKWYELDHDGYYVTKKMRGYYEKSEKQKMKPYKQQISDLVGFLDNKKFFLIRADSAEEWKEL